MSIVSLEQRVIDRYDIEELITLLDLRVEDIVWKFMDQIEANEEIMSEITVEFDDDTGD